MNKEYDKRKGKISKSYNVRLDPHDRETLLNNGISLSKTIEEYIDNNLNAYGFKRHKLRVKQNELKEIEKAEERKKELLIEINELKKEIGYVEINGIEINPDALENAKAFARYYMNAKIKYSNIKDFVKENKNKIEPKSLEYDLNLKTFSELIEKEVNKLNKELDNENKIIKQNKYNMIRINENINNDIKEQLYNAQKRAKNIINKHNSSINNIETYIKSNDIFMSNYANKYNITKDKFIKLLIETYNNSIKEKN